MILALDVGLKRIGIAGLISGVVLPLDPILRHNRDQAAQDVSKLIESRGAKTLLIGLPEIEDTKARILHFASLLKTDAKIIYINEDYSSKESQSYITHLKKKSRQNANKDGRLDSLAACRILERYLLEYKI